MRIPNLFSKSAMESTAARKTRLKTRFFSLINIPIDIKACLFNSLPSAPVAQWLSAGVVFRTHYAGSIPRSFFFNFFCIFICVMYCTQCM